MSRFRWWRRLRGGHWEQWWIDSPVNADVWLRMPCTRGTTRRPPGGMGTPRCEDWTA